MAQDNRDKCVELLQRYARRFFPATRYLDYALRVEAYTLTKAANLVLNVDGCIGALFLDLLHSSSQFSQARSPWTFAALLQPVLAGARVCVRGLTASAWLSLLLLGQGDMT